MKNDLMKYSALSSKFKRLISKRSIHRSAVFAVIILAMFAVHRFAAAKSGTSPRIERVTEAAAAVPAPTSEVNTPVLQGEVMPSELLTIRPHGFEPAQITRKAGQFFLAIENRSQVEELSLGFDRVGGQRFQEVRVQRGRPDMSSTVGLPPGDYNLTEASHPGWTCRITITAK